MSDSRFQPLGLAQTMIAAAQFARPADTTAYASGDLVANSTTAGSVVPLQLQNAVRAPARLGGRIIGVRLFKGHQSITNAQFRVHFFTLTPVVANGDNGVFAPDNASLENWIGSMDVTVAVASAARAVGRGDPAAAQQNGIPFRLPNPDVPTLFALLEARGAYTPASAETFLLRADILQE